MIKATISEEEKSIIKADLILLSNTQKLKSAGAKRDYCKLIGCGWDEYLSIKRKYSKFLKTK